MWLGMARVISVTMRRLDGVGADAVLGEFLRRCLGQADDTGLGCGVVGWPKNPTFPEMIASRVMPALLTITSTEPEDSRAMTSPAPRAAPVIAATLSWRSWFSAERRCPRRLAA